MAQFFETEAIILIKKSYNKTSNIIRQSREKDNSSCFNKQVARVIIEKTSNKQNKTNFKVKNR